MKRLITVLTCSVVMFAACKKDTESRFHNCGVVVSLSLVGSEYWVVYKYDDGNDAQMKVTAEEFTHYKVGERSCELK